VKLFVECQECFAGYCIK